VEHLSEGTGENNKTPVRMRLEVLIAVKILMLVFWAIMPYGLVGIYQRSRGT
jgi:hypothetical protein